MPYITLADGTVVHYRGKAALTVEDAAAISDVVSVAVARLRAAMVAPAGEKRRRVEHDYTTGYRRWGHNYAVASVECGGRRLQVSGWGAGIRKGDVLLLSNSKGGTPRYLVRRIEYCRDPADMWHATLLWLPRPMRSKG